MPWCAPLSLPPKNSLLAAIPTSAVRQNKTKTPRGSAHLLTLSLSLVALFPSAERRGRSDTRSEGEGRKKAGRTWPRRQQRRKPPLMSTARQRQGRQRGRLQQQQEPRSRAARRPRREGAAATDPSRRHHAPRRAGTAARPLSRLPLPGSRIVANFSTVSFLGPSQ